MESLPMKNIKVQSIFLGGSFLDLFRGSLLFGLGNHLALFTGILLIVGGH